jgi:HTH-type transcriptional regulator / antitoxin HigA
MLKPIKTEEQYEEALETIWYLMDSQPTVGTSKGDELDILEAKHYPMPSVEPIEYLKLIMESKHLKQSDLVPFIGHKSQVSKILNGKRELTLSMVRNLSRGLNLPLQKLVGI